MKEGEAAQFINEHGIAKWFPTSRRFTSSPAAGSGNAGADEKPCMLVHDAYSSCGWRCIGNAHRQVHWGVRTFAVRGERKCGILFDRGASTSSIGIDTMMAPRADVVWPNDRHVEFLCHTSRRLSGIDGVVNKSPGRFRIP